MRNFVMVILLVVSIIVGTYAAQYVDRLIDKVTGADSSSNKTMLDAINEWLRK